MADTSMNQALSYQFFNRPTLIVAQELLGKYLTRRIGETLLIGKIVETEAYLGTDDAAAHSAAGRTDRTNILYGEPGRAYIFQLRGHHLLNVVTEGVNSPAGVLFRALEPIQGAEYFEQKGVRFLKNRHLMNGPGKLCKVLEINMSHNGTDLTSTESLIYVSEGSDDPIEIETTTRIGISKAIDKPFRFILKGSPFISR